MSPDPTTPTLDWVENNPGSSSATLVDLAFTSDGDLFTGLNYISARFGYSYSSISGNGSDAFVTKLDADFRPHRWSQRFGGTAGDASSALAAGPDGVVYLVGGYRGTFGVDGAVWSVSETRSSGFVIQLVP